MKTRPWIGRMTLPAVAVAATLTVTLLPAASASAAQAMSMHESSMGGGAAHHHAAPVNLGQSGGDHNGDRDHHSLHRFGGRPGGIYYIYPYNQYSYRWTYPYYPAPTYVAPTYWYYCPSYAAYYPYVASCPESWVVVPAS